MTDTIRARTARVPHKCDSCYWFSDRRGVATIAPGHRYLIHTRFPGWDNEATKPYTNTECVACACDHDSSAGMLIADACSTFCCGDVPCARPWEHAGDHSCRRCFADGIARARAEQMASVTS